LFITTGAIVDDQGRTLGTLNAFSHQAGASVQKQMRNSGRREQGAGQRLFSRQPGLRDTCGLPGDRQTHA